MKYPKNCNLESVGVKMKFFLTLACCTRHPYPSGPHGHTLEKNDKLQSTTPRRGAPRRNHSTAIDDGTAALAADEGYALLPCRRGLPPHVFCLLRRGPLSRGAPPAPPSPPATAPHFPCPARAPLRTCVGGLPEKFG
jgi:hypothetical protein